MAKPLRVLHVGAHPADAIDHAGGTLANHAARGDHVTTVTLTHGVQSHAWNLIAKSRKQQKSIDSTSLKTAIEDKEREIMDAGSVLGIQDLRFLRLEDGIIIKTPQIVRQMAKIIKEVRPDILITHSPLEGGGVGAGHTHAICADIVLSAFYQACGLIEGDDTPPHEVSQIFFMGQFGQDSIFDFESNRFPYILIDITDVVEKKVRALEKLKSQFYSGPAGRKLIECQNGYFAFHARVPYVEPFYPWRPEVYKTLPVSDFNLKLKSRTSKELFDESARMIVPFLD